jgi:hypothetical protein
VSQPHYDGIAGDITTIAHSYLLDDYKADQGRWKVSRSREPDSGSHRGSESPGRYRSESPVELRDAVDGGVDPSPNIAQERMELGTLLRRGIGLRLGTGFDVQMLEICAEEPIDAGLHQLPERLGGPRWPL